MRSLPTALEEENQKVVCDVALTTPPILVDPFLFGQILDNLVSNASKYSLTGSTIRIGNQFQEPFLAIYVDDEGPGIPEEERGLLFVKFAKLSLKPTAGESSIGLGLSIVKHLTEIMDGTIVCDSEVGRGTRFTVSFIMSDCRASVAT